MALPPADTFCSRVSTTSVSFAAYFVSSVADPSEPDSSVPSAPAAAASASLMIASSSASLVSSTALSCAGIFDALTAVPGTATQRLMPRRRAFTYLFFITIMQDFVCIRTNRHYPALLFLYFYCGSSALVMRKAKMTKKEKKEKASVKTLAKAIMPPGSTPDGMLLSGFQKKPHRSRYIYPKNLLGNNGYRLPFFPG